MRQFAILLVTILAVVAVGVLGGDIHGVEVSLGGGKDAKGIVYSFLDDQITVRQLAQKALATWHMSTDIENLRMESHFGLTYNLDKTLEEAGVKDGSRLKLKYWNRFADIGSVILRPLTPDSY